MLNMGKSIHRLGIMAVVCALVLGVISLATEAKTSQYHSHRAVDRYFSESTKMSEGRDQHAIFPQFLLKNVVELDPDVITLAMVPPCPREIPAPRLITVFHPFLFRPPPVL